MQSALLTAAIRAVYPPQCVSCGALTDSDFGLCGTCWRDTHFIGGLTCDLCGVPLPGADDGTAVHCDDCMTIARPWDRGRAVLRYRDNGRALVLKLKHGDRTDLARSLGDWMAGAARPLLSDDMLIVPVPLHWTRLLKRRFNQAGLLAQRIGRVTGHRVVADALIRPAATRPLDGHSRDARFAALSGAIRPHPGRRSLIAGRPVLVVDDVMTSGATFAAATDALRSAGATRVCVLALARVGKDD